MPKCPDTTCQRRHVAQDKLSAHQLSRIAEADRYAISLVPGPVYQCTYCNAVYTLDDVLHGWLDSEVLGQGWHPKSK